MKQLVIDTVEIEGIDKTGKDIIAEYVYRLSNHRYIVRARGTISASSYEVIYSRTSYFRELNKNTLYVLLDAVDEDLDVRFSIHKELEIDREYHRYVFNSYFNVMTDGLHTLKYNTSFLTPYQIAKDIISYLDKINEI